MKNNNQINVPQAREAMDRFKMQAASEVGVNLTNGPPVRPAPSAARWSRTCVPDELKSLKESAEFPRDMYSGWST